jgi:hypothetical protein
MIKESSVIPTAKKRPWWFWVFSILATMLLVVVLNFVVAVIGLAWLMSPEEQVLRGPYQGVLLWNEQSLGIQWEEDGTLDNDGDHEVVIISGEGLRLRMVWGMMASAGGHVGQRAEVDQALVPEGWPVPVGLVVVRATSDGGWQGVLETREKESLVLRLDAPK